MTSPSTGAQIIYGNNQLALVIGQVRYPELPRFDDDAYVRGFAEALRDQYPLASSEPALNIVVTEAGDVTRQEAGKIFRFNTIDKAYAVVLSREFVALECRQYAKFQDFIERLHPVLTLVRDCFAVKWQLRAGLRYINEMRWDKLRTYEQWRERLNAEYMGWDPAPVLKGRVLHTLAEFALQRDDGVYILRRGFLRGSTVASDVVPNVPEYYLIDHDYTDSHPREFDVNPIDRFRAYNDYMVNVFTKMTDSHDLQMFLMEGPSDE
jgi:uncharacterized protein (TIGR04255 family)